MIALGLTGGGVARADGNDAVAAEALFEQGRTLAAQGKYADACPRFADSQRLDPSPGTLLNLANCYEKLGRTATAWATYHEAASAANAAGRTEYVQSAERHADALAGHLAKLTMTVTQPVDGLLVKRDGVQATRAEWGVAIPIDSGTHALEASAPGYQTWTSTVSVPQDGAQVSITVPALEAAPAQPAAPTPAVPVAPAAPAPEPAAPPPADTTKGSSQRVLGIVIGSVGLVSLATSGTFAVLAKAKYNDSLQDCPTSPNVCTAPGVSERDNALTFGNVASVTLAVGAAALVGGVALWLTAPSAPAASQSARAAIGVSPMAGPGVGGVVMRGSW